MSAIVDSVILGIIEGITEFLPISSTGHLIIAGHLLNFEGPTAETFEIFIQLGAILAVVVLYWKRFLGLLSFSDKGGLSGWSGLTKIGAACAPAFFFGFLLHGFIKRHLFSSFTVAIGFIVGAVLFILVEKRKNTAEIESPELITIRDAFVIGLFQCLALWPGMSRSGSTIIGGLLVKCSRKAAAEFSFLVAVPVMCAAVGLDMLKSYKLLTSSDIPLFAVGFIVSFLTAIVAIRGFLGFLGKYTLIPFAIYRIVAGILILVLSGGHLAGAFSYNEGSTTPVQGDVQAIATH